MQRVVLCVASIALAVAQGSCRAQLITEQQARQAVISFEAQPSIEFSGTELETLSSGPAWMHRPEYFLLCSDEGKGWMWRVDAATGEVVLANHDDAYPPEDGEADEPFGSLSEEQCRQIADAFAHAHYSGFGAINLVTSPTGSWVRHGWRSAWWEELPCGAPTPNGVTVTVSPTDGRVQSYSCLRIPTPQVPAPQLTSQGAIQSAAAAAGIVSLAWNETPLLRADPDGIFWTVEVGGEDANGEGVLRLVTLDAATGAVHTIESPGVGPTAREPSTVSANGVAESGTMLRVKDLAASLGGTVSWSHGSKTALLTVSGHTCLLRLGSSTALLDGKPVKLERELTISRGRMVVPTGLARRLKAARGPRTSTNGRAAVRTTVEWDVR